MAASPHDVESDAILVVAAQAGDPDAFSELFRRHYPSIRRTCARKLRDLREADEIAQAAFVRAYERLDQCGGDRRFGAWVQVIANNLCIDHLRASARTTPTDEPIEHATVTPAHLPEDALLNAEQAELIRRALASLPDRQRDVVVARDVDGRRPPEIAAALGLSLGAVDSLLLRARRRLAASVQSMSAENGAASFMTTAAVGAVGGTVGKIGTLSRAMQFVSETVATASYHVAVAAGMVPGMPSLASQIAPVAAAGLASLAPAVGGQAPEVAVPAVPSITATVPAAPVPSPPTMSDVLNGARTSPVPAIPTDASVPATTVPAPAVASIPAAAEPVAGSTPRVLEQVDDGVADTLRGLLGNSSAR